MVGGLTNTSKLKPPFELQTYEYEDGQTWEWIDSNGDNDMKNAIVTLTELLGGEHETFIRKRMLGEKGLFKQLFRSRTTAAQQYQSDEKGKGAATLLEQHNEEGHAAAINMAFDILCGEIDESLVRRMMREEGIQEEDDMKKREEELMRDMEFAARLQHEENARGMADNARDYTFAEQLQREEAARELERQKEERELFNVFLEEDMQTRQRENERRVYRCEICFCDDFTIDQMYTLETCDHRFCFDCVQGYVDSKIGDGDVTEDRFICPKPDCPKPLTRKDIAFIFPDEGGSSSEGEGDRQGQGQGMFTRFLDTFSGNDSSHMSISESGGSSASSRKSRSVGGGGSVRKKKLAKYDDYILQRGLENMDDLRYCQKCNFPMVIEDIKTNPMIRCPNEECKYAYCDRCECDWHNESTCERYQQWKKDNEQNDDLNSEWKRQHSKNCPQCNKSVEKSGGCNHITCKCGAHFCWLCGEDITKAGYNHFTKGKCGTYS